VPLGVRIARAPTNDSELVGTVLLAVILAGPTRQPLRLPNLGSRSIESASQSVVSSTQLSREVSLGSFLNRNHGPFESFSMNMSVLHSHEW
jgi:hypothetical protein